VGKHARLRLVLAVIRLVAGRLGRPATAIADGALGQARHGRQDGRARVANRRKVRVLEPFFPLEVRAAGVAAEALGGVPVEQLLDERLAVRGDVRVVGPSEFLVDDVGEGVVGVVAAEGGVAAHHLEEKKTQEGAAIKPRGECMPTKSNSASDTSPRYRARQ